MKESISFTIPLEVKTLNRTAEMLQGMASDLATKPCGDCNKEEKPAVAPSIKGESKIEKPPTPPATNATLAGAENMGDEEKQDAPPPPGVDLDSAGLPWDGRIHSAGKTKLVNGGTWKKIRKVDQALVDQVEAELRAAMAAATPETPAATTTPPTPPADIPPLADTQVPPANVIPPPINETPPPTPPAANAEPLTFPLFMSKVTNAMALGTLTDVRILEVVNKHGLASLPLLSARPDFIPAIDAELFPNG